jgi:hypothetical protein
MGTLSLVPDFASLPRGWEGATSDRRRARTFNAATMGKRANMSDYTLIDECGQPVGTIVAPETKPVLGQHAPTFYMRRTLN